MTPQVGNSEIIATSIARPGPTARPKSGGKPQILSVKNENILSKMDTKIDELSLKTTQKYRQIVCRISRFTSTLVILRFSV